jgi:putative oxidoreductase
MKRNLLLDMSCSFLILLWVYAAASKWMQFKMFVGTLSNQVLPHWIVYPLAYLLPLFELLTAIGLCFSHYRKAGFWASLILLTGFTVYITAILLRLFPRVPCSCGGVISNLSWLSHLFFNLFFLLLSIVGLSISNGKSNRFSILKSTKNYKGIHA